MIVQQETWKDIPLLHIFKEDMHHNTPVLIFLHGFTSAKEHNLHFAYTLVNLGVRVIMPDAVLHGERSKGYTEQQLTAEFWQIVVQSVQEVGVLYAEMQQRGWTGKVAIAGTSMGGIVTSGCLRTYPFIAAAGILMGVASYTDFAAMQLAHFKKQGLDLGYTEEQQQRIFSRLQPYNLKDEPSVLERVPTFFWHAVNDAVVPFSLTRPFYETLLATGKAEKVHYVVDEKAGHKVTRLAMQEMCHFITQHLA